MSMDVLVRDGVAIFGFIVVALLVCRNFRSAQRINASLFLLANHEIRTPLAVIHGALQTVRAGADLSPEDRAYLLHAALHRSEEALRLIDKYLRVEEAVSRKAPGLRIVRPLALFKRGVA